MKPRDAVLTQGPAAEPGFAALCQAILSGSMPLLDVDGPEPDVSLPMAIPLIWLDAPVPPLVLVELHAERVSLHVYELSALPEIPRRRMLRRLDVLARRLLRHGPPEDFALIPAADCLEVLNEYADKQATPLRHAIS